MLRAFIWLLVKLIFLVLIAASLFWLFLEVSQRGHLGDYFPEFLDRIGQILAAVFKEYAFLLDKAPQVLATVATLISGSLAIYKAYYFGNKRLPERLKEFLEQRDERILKARPARIAGFQALHLSLSSDNRAIKMPAWERTQRKMSYMKLTSLRNQLRDRLGVLDQQFGLAVKNLDSINKELLHSHILQGVDLATQAASSANAARRKLDHEKALASFEQAVKFGPKSIEALALACEQMRILDDARRRDWLQRLIDAAREQSDHFTHAVALHEVALVEAAAGQHASQFRAIKYLEQALAVLTEVKRVRENTLTLQVRSHDKIAELRESMGHTQKAAQHRASAAPVRAKLAALHGGS